MTTSPERLTQAREKARQQRKDRSDAGLTPNFTPAEKAARYPGSRKLATEANCWDCEGRDADPAVDWRIGNCVCPNCFLYGHRPYQHLAGTPKPRVLRCGEERELEFEFEFEFAT